MKRIAHAFADELRRIVTEPGALLVLVAAVFLYAAFYPLPYSREVLKESVVAVVDLDGTPASRALRRMIDAHELLRATGSASMTDAEERVRMGEAAAVVVIPRAFERRVLRGEACVVPVYADASYFLTYRQLLTGLAETIGTASAGVELRRQGLGFATRAGMRDPLRVSFRALFNPTESYRRYIVPAVLMLILQQTLLVGIGIIHGGRRAEGTAAELLGRAGAYLMLYAVHASIYFGPLFRLYGFERSGGWLLAAATALFLLAVTFLGFAVASLLPRREAAIPVLLVTSLPILFLAGFAWPVESMPRALRVLAAAIPSTHMITAMLRLTTMHAELAAVRAPLAWLALLAVAYGALALLLGERASRPQGAGRPARR